ncbi:MAG: L,D-transpeptidase [Caldilineaceae bacterium]|nr:L,D-transpeptidase [Caldilineaceae bacterium]
MLGNTPNRRLTLHHILWSACLVGVLLFFNTQRGLAQSPVGGALDPARSDAKAAAPPAADSEAATAARRLTNTFEPMRKPPLPFTEPQIGPLIKRAYQDDIEQRTTAFMPQSLDTLTPITMPTEARWIRVDLSEQIVVAYEGEKPVRAFIVSSGLPGTPTVTGEFRIRTKVSEQVMYGGVGANYYYLPGVKWVQYFYQDYSFHGTYWHNNFGQPMSHGCLNMTNADAKWLFDWAGPTWDGKTTWYKSSTENPGTLVIITQ